MKKSDGKIRGTIEDNIRAILFAVVVALTVRTFAFEPFRIPSSSMVPSMLIGDFLFVSKYSYGYSNTGSFFRIPLISDNESRIFQLSAPKRGEIAVFKLPSNPNINYIKRVIGEPGDKIQLKDEVVYINGTPLNKEEVGTYTNDEGEEFVKYIEKTFSGKKYNVIEQIPNEEYDNTIEFEVPEGHYFMMGDNRDNSADCRTSQIPYPFVPLENFVGRAEMIFFSVNYDENNFSIKNLFGIRFNRLFNLINKSI